MKRESIVILLAFLALVASPYAAVAKDIDEKAINHPMFDSRMENTSITIQAGAELYTWFQSNRITGHLSETVDRRIVGGYLFPNHYQGDEINWWYYVTYTNHKEQNYYWIRDTDFLSNWTSMSSCSELFKMKHSECSRTETGGKHYRSS
jgi:hypothetical protein